MSAVLFSGCLSLLVRPSVVLVSSFSRPCLVRFAFLPALPLCLFYFVLFVCLFRGLSFPCSRGVAFFRFAVTGSRGDGYNQKHWVGMTNLSVWEGPLFLGTKARDVRCRASKTRARRAACACGACVIAVACGACGMWCSSVVRRVVTTYGMLSCCWPVSYSRLGRVRMQVAVALGDERGMQHHGAPGKDESGAKRIYTSLRIR